MIERKTYLRQLIQLKNEHLIKVVTGIKRCGKSTLMLQFQDWLKTSGVKRTSAVKRVGHSSVGSVYCYQHAPVLFF